MLARTAVECHTTMLGGPPVSGSRERAGVGGAGTGLQPGVVGRPGSGVGDGREGQGVGHPPVGASRGG